MGLYFGTDGIRGEFGKNLTLEMAYKCGKALAMQKTNVKILIGRDTRKSGQILTLAFVLGAIVFGADIVDVSVCPTAGISFLTTKEKFDFGVVVSASHNDEKYNGIKIFDCAGKKLGDKGEFELEKKFFASHDIDYAGQLGTYNFQPNLVEDYKDFLCDDSGLQGLKIVLDCANGAACFVAPEVFKKLGAEVVVINDVPDGHNINKDCGALCLRQIQNCVLKEKADIGFAFDGDSDRVIAIDEKGNIIDGDKLIYLFATNYQKENKLKCNIVVGTKMTNMGVEKALLKHKIKLIRADVGDKYVGEMLEKNDLFIGGEQCGHLFLKDRLVTGDGILNAVMVAQTCKKRNKKLSDFFAFENFYQENKNIKVSNKNIILECKNLQDLILKIQNKLKKKGRVVVRASGTEDIIRIMVEAKEKEKAQKYIQEITSIIEKINKEI